jgi:colanic acid biosynthesis protein WcaH
VALAYRVIPAMTLHNETLHKLPQQQHTAYRWLSVRDLINDQTVHPHTRAYFE